MRDSLICVLLMAIVLTETKRRVLKEVRFKGGVANCSSRGSSQGKNGPETAFKRINERDHYWASGLNVSGKGAHQSYPHLIWYDFGDAREPVVPAEVSFTTSEPSQFGPTKWQFIGARASPCDRYSAWSILCEDLSGRKFTMSSQIKSCQFDGKSHFTCLGIRVLDAPDEYFHSDGDGYGTGYPWSRIVDIRMWEKA